MRVQVGAALLYDGAPRVATAADNHGGSDHGNRKWAWEPDAVVFPLYETDYTKGVLGNTVPFPNKTSSGKQCAMGRLSVGLSFFRSILTTLKTGHTLQGMAYCLAMAPEAATCMGCIDACFSLTALPRSSSYGHRRAHRLATSPGLLLKISSHRGHPAQPS